MTSTNASRTTSPRLAGPTRAAALLVASVLAAPRAVLSGPPDPLALNPSKVYTTTSMNVGPNLSATLTEYFTGEKNERTAMNILLGIHVSEEGRRRLVASRDYNAAAGGYVSRGSLELIDLDVLRLATDKLVLLWTGPVRVNTAAPSAGVAPSDRDQFVREIDYARTTASGGRKICFAKTVGVAAGAVLDPPRVLNEEIPLAEK